MDIINKTYKYRLKLTKTQEELIDSWIHTCRFIYNLALETKITAYNGNKKYLSAYDLQKQITVLRHDFDWIQSVPHNVLQDVTERLDRNYKQFFNGGGFPKFANRDKYKSITFKSVKQINSYTFRLHKIGCLKVYKDRHTKGDIRRATIIKKNNKYYISILTKQERETVPIIHDNRHKFTKYIFILF